MNKTMKAFEPIGAKSRRSPRAIQTRSQSRGNNKEDSKTSIESMYAELKNLSVAFKQKQSDDKKNTGQHENVITKQTSPLKKLHNFNLSAESGEAFKFSSGVLNYENR
jgi:hypothetical protein